MFSLIFTRPDTAWHTVRTEGSEKRAVPQATTKPWSVRSRPRRLSRDGSRTWVAPSRRQKARIGHCGSRRGRDGSAVSGQRDKIPCIDFFREDGRPTDARADGTLRRSPTKSWPLIHGQAQRLLAGDGRSLRCAEVRIDRTPTQNRDVCGKTGDFLPERSGTVNGRRGGGAGHGSTFFR